MTFLKVSEMSCHGICKNDLLKIVHITFIIFSILGVYFTNLSLQFRDSSIVFSFVFLAFIGFFLFSNGSSRTLFLFHYVLYSLFAICFYEYYTSVNGASFIGGGDDEFFYKISKGFYLDNFERNRFYEGVFFPITTYQGYIYTLSGYLWILNVLGFDSTNVFHFILINVLVGSFSGMLVFRIARKIGYQLGGYLFIITLFPVTVWYGVTLLRDSFILFFFLLLIDTLVSSEKLTLKQILLSVLWIILTATIRPAHAIIFSFLLGVKFFFSIQGIVSKVLLIMVAIIVIFTFLESSVNDQLEEVSQVAENYDSEISENASGSSIGRLLYSSSNPVFIVIRPVVLFFSPIPPLIFSGLTFDNLFLSIGNLLWYFFGASFLVLLYVKGRTIIYSNIYLSLTSVILFTPIIISLTSRDPRHIVFVYPIVQILVLQGIIKKEISVKLICLSLSAMGLLLVSFYLLLKAIL